MQKTHNSRTFLDWTKSVDLTSNPGDLPSLLPGKKVKKKGKGALLFLLMGILPSDTATGRHLPYRITQCYLLSDTSERAPP